MENLNKPLLFSEIKENTDVSILTTNDKFNQWFSRYSPNAKKPKFGGLVRKSVVFVTGSSGAGKTTTMFNIMNWMPKVKSSFYARECDLDEIKDQINPFEISHNNAQFSDVNIYPHFNDFMNHLERDQPEIVMVDSLQAIADSDFIEMGEDQAIKYIRQELTKYIKKRGGVLFIIGHNTKEGEFAGKNKNMQMVDAHMVLEYDKKTNVRKMFWGQKNRKGPMKTMYYEIQDGTIVYFTPEEYAIQKSNEIEDVVAIPNLENKKITIKELTPKVMYNMFVEQFKENSGYTSFKLQSDSIVKNILSSYKKSYKNNFAESHAYFNALNSVYTLAIQQGLLTSK